VGLVVVDILHVGFCTTVDSGFDVGGGRGRCGGRYAEYYDQRDSSMGSGGIVGCADGYFEGSNKSRQTTLLVEVVHKIEDIYNSDAP
jgi:hypothetical protein